MSTFLKDLNSPTLYMEVNKTNNGDDEDDDDDGGDDDDDDDDGDGDDDDEFLGSKLPTHTTVFRNSNFKLHTFH